MQSGRELGSPVTLVQDGKAVGRLTALIMVRVVNVHLNRSQGIPPTSAGGRIQ